MEEENKGTCVDCGTTDTTVNDDGKCTDCAGESAAGQPGEGGGDAGESGSPPDETPAV